MDQKDNRCIIELTQKQSSPKFTLYCFPPAGSSTSFYRCLIDCIPNGIRAVGVVLPGRQTRVSEVECVDVIELARQFIDLEIKYQTGAYGFLGFSFGGIVAYQICQQISNAGGSSLLLCCIIAACAAPDKIATVTKKEKLKFVTLQDDKEFFQAINEFTCGEYLKDINPTYAERIISSIIPWLRADFTAMYNYSFLPDKDDKVLPLEDIHSWKSFLPLTSVFNFEEGMSHLFCKELWFKTSLTHILKTILSDISKEAVTSYPIWLEDGKYLSGGLMDLPSDHPTTLLQALTKLHDLNSSKGITYVDQEGVTFQSYPTLYKEALHFLSSLQEIVPSCFTSPQRSYIILQVTNLRKLFTSWWGCVMGGIIPINVATPRFYKYNDSTIQKLLHVWSDIGHPPIIVESKWHVETLKSLADTEFNIIAADDCFQQSTVRKQPIVHQPKPDEVFFLQLSSGSTGKSKCIQVTHNGVINHVLSSQKFNSYSGDDVTLNWLPPDHIVPMLTVHLKDVYLNCSEVQVNTTLVLANPLAWIDLVHTYRVTHTWSPNFGYKLVAKAAEHDLSRDWDLSCVKFFMNAGEQVTLPACIEFVKTLKPFGLSPTAMQPAFGMAESCTTITYFNKFLENGEEGPFYVNRNSISEALKFASYSEYVTCPQEFTIFMNLGPPIPGIQLRVVSITNPDHVLPEGRIGRVQFRGAVVTPGYLSNPNANKEAFMGDGWFDTGDLGFIKDCHLALTGRIKEAIRIRGTDVFAYDIEEYLSGYPNVVKPGFVGVCSLHDNEAATDALAICYVPPTGSIVTPECIVTIKEIITKSFGISPRWVVPVVEAEFPRTTSGKIQRLNLRNYVSDYEERIAPLNKLFYQGVWEQNVIQKFSSPTSRDLIIPISQTTTILDSYVSSYDRIIIQVTCDTLTPLQVTNTLIMLLTRCANLIMTNNSSSKPKLWVVTSGSHNYNEIEELEQSQPLSSNSAWGICRCFGLTYPSLWGGIVDLHHKDDIIIIPESTQTQYRFESPNTWLTYSIKHCVLPYSRKQKFVNGYFLIVGGTGDLGLQVAKYLADSGASMVILASQHATRRLQEPNVKKVVDGLSCRVMVKDVDVTSKEQVKNLFMSLADLYPSLNGVFHLAGQLVVDSSISKTGLSDSFNSKIAACYLHECTKNLKLDYFVMFSSMSSVLGAPGIAGYTAGQSILDFIGHYRHQQGLPALTLNWGPWSEIGLASRSQWDQSIMGILPLLPSSAIHAMDVALSGKLPQMMITNIEWPEYVKYFHLCSLSHLSSLLPSLHNTIAFQHQEHLQSSSSNPASVNINKDYNNISSIVLNCLQNSLTSVNSLEDLRSLHLDTLESLEIQRFIGSLREKGYSIPASLIFTPGITVHDIILFLGSKSVRSQEEKVDDKEHVDINQNDIAICGMDIKLPGVQSLEDYWEALCSKTVSFCEISDKRKALQPNNHFTKIEHNYNINSSNSNTLYGAFLSDIDMFDYNFFHISKSEAKDMDPQQRIVLESVVKALCHAGIEPTSLRGKKNIGVFMGAHYQDFLECNILQSPYTATGSSLNNISNRVSNFLGVTGPSMTVATACSSSLVAVDLAIQHLQHRRCDICIVGGVQVNLSLKPWDQLDKLGVLSPSNRCRPFQEAADGIVRGEGCGVVILCRLSDAVAIGVPVLGLIAGTCVNHNGPVRLTTPNPISLKEVIQGALKSANLQTDDVEAIECHQTATKLGDQIECESIASVFEKRTGRPLYLSCLKEYFGHLESASGIAGLIKAVLALQHKLFPPQGAEGAVFNSVLSENCNSICVSTSPVKLGIGAIGVSSFGYGGTNAHVIIKPYISVHPKSKLISPPIFTKEYVWINHPVKEILQKETNKLSIENTIREVLTTHVQIKVNLDMLLASESLIFHTKMDSLTAIAVAQTLSTVFNIKLSQALIYEYPTINEIVDHLYEKLQLSESPLQFTPKSAIDVTEEPIAVTAMAGRFPGCRSIEEYWKLLCEQNCAIDDIPKSRWNKEEYYDPTGVNGMYTIKLGCIDGVYDFDAEHFKISPEEARMMDPQHRHLLEVVHECLLDGGYDIKSLFGSKTGVFIGLTNHDYEKVISESASSAYIGLKATGCAPSVAAGRIAYVFGFKGTTMTIDTACSSSLYSVIMACEQLRTRSVDMALTGGVNLILHPETSIALSQLKMISNDGLCSTFSESASGYGRGEGCGIIVLKRLKDAIASGDHIYGLIQGTVTNQDGRSSTLTAPSRSSQESLISAAVQNANIRPEDVDFIETHGTGTVLGDMIEVNAIATSLCTNERTKPLEILAVKPNIGHAESAAGIASLIKALLITHHRYIPGNIIHGGKFNSKLKVSEWMQFPTINHHLSPTGQIIGSVSSFGWSGSNANIIVSSSDNTYPWESKQFSHTWNHQEYSIARPIRKQVFSTSPDIQVEAKNWHISWKNVKRMDCMEPNDPNKFLLVTCDNNFYTAIACADSRFRVIHINDWKDSDLAQVTRVVLFASQVLPYPKTTDELKDQVDNILKPFLILSHAIIKQGNIRLSLVTQNTVNPSPVPRKISLTNSIVVGFMKNFWREHPMLFGGIIDMLSPEDILSTLEELQYYEEHLELQVALHGGSRWVARLESTVLDFQELTETTIIPSKAYIVVGGRGGLGELLATKLVHMGASNVYTLSRTIGKKSTEHPAIIACKVDITSFDELNTFFKTVVQPIGGIIHAGGTTTNIFINDMTLSSAWEVMAVKVLGTWNLHQCLLLHEKEPIDFFILLSSVSTLWGNAGGGHYTACNSFLDSFAQCRHAHGRKAISINFGGFSQVGMLSHDPDMINRLEQCGLIMLNPEIVCQALKFCSLQQYLISCASVGDIFFDLLELHGRVPFIEFAKKSSPVPIQTPLPKTQNNCRQVLVEVLQQFSPDSQSIIESPLEPCKMDSLTAVHITQVLKSKLNINLTNDFIWNYPTFDKMCKYLDSLSISQKPTSIMTNPVENILLNGEPVVSESMVDNSDEDWIAVTGMAGRFSSANTLSQFWDILCSQRNVISEIPRDRGQFSEKILAGFIENVYDFDAEHFKISSEEAQMMDPQQRHLLEVVHECLLDAGYDLQSLFGSKTGVFIGMTHNDYLKVLESHGVLPSGMKATGCAPSVASGRISNFYGLQGTSVTIDTACSSSLVAVISACDQIRSGSIDMAIAGGVNLILHTDTFTALSKMKMTAEDGISKTFSSAADGYGRGEGCAVIILKRLKDAQKSADHIYGVIRGYATNNNGQTNTLTSPKGTVQESLICASVQSANIRPEDVDFIETHGTGTVLGDMIEVNAIATSLCTNERTKPLEILAVKPNIGHAESAAGIASLIKALLITHHRYIPGNIIHGGKFNSKLKVSEWMQFPTINHHLSPTGQIIGSVSSFGWSGSNANVLISSYPLSTLTKKSIKYNWNHKTYLPPYTPGKQSINNTIIPTRKVPVKLMPRMFLPFISKILASFNCLPISNDSNILETGIDSLTQFSIMDKLCYGLGGLVISSNEFYSNFTISQITQLLCSHSLRRPDLLPHIITTCANSFLFDFIPTENIFSVELQPNVNIYVESSPNNGTPPLVLCVPGQGSQYVGMANNIKHPRAMALFNEASSIVGYDIFQLATVGTEEQLLDLEKCPVAILVTALAMWEELKATKGSDIRISNPDYAIGLSIGEYGALVIAGVISFADAIRIVSARGQAMKMSMHMCKEETGMACIIGVDEAVVVQMLSDKNTEGISIANYLCDDMVTIAGPTQMFKYIHERVESIRGARWKRLAVSGACHTVYMKDVEDAIDRTIETIQFHPPKCHLIFNIDGQEHSNPEEIKKLMKKQVSSPVLWKQSINLLKKLNMKTEFVCLGPGTSLQAIIK